MWKSRHIYLLCFPVSANRSAPFLLTLFVPLIHFIQPGTHTTIYCHRTGTEGIERWHTSCALAFKRRIARREPICSLRAGAESHFLSARKFRGGSSHLPGWAESLEEHFIRDKSRRTCGDRCASGSRSRGRFPLWLIVPISRLLKICSRTYGLRQIDPDALIATRDLHRGHSHLRWRAYRSDQPRRAAVQHHHYSSSGQYLSQTSLSASARLKNAQSRSCLAVRFAATSTLLASMTTQCSTMPCERPACLLCNALKT